MPLFPSPKFSNTDNIELDYKTVIVKKYTQHFAFCPPPPQPFCVLGNGLLQRTNCLSPYHIGKTHSPLSLRTFIRPTLIPLFVYDKSKHRPFSLLPEHAVKVRHRLSNSLYFDEWLTEIRTFSLETNWTQRWTFPVKLTGQDFLFLKSNSNSKPQHL